MKSIHYFVIAVLFSISGIYAQSDFNTKKGIAINGYDVVSYFDGKPKKGDKIFAVDYEDTTFLFSSEENLDKFEAAPKDFLPQYGGYCAYAVAVKSKKVDVDPETFEVRDGKLFLFYNKWSTNTLTLWKNENPKELKKKADTNWQKIGKK
ncbi:YHS domain-containing (seleno)protein [Ascidiimonas sp. W6]|uniref:YHS domain-containing (seleno)protein n=1 Tax=Ascidiimonas meishanensis TaxID=3128903 RepID=UPI0030EC2212